MSRKKPAPRWVSLKEAYDYSGISRRSLYRYEDQGLISMSRTTGKCLVDLNELDAMLEKGKR